MRFVCLGGLALGLAAVMAVIGYDLITKPRDIWIVVCYVAGTVMGIALDRNRPRR